MEVQVLDLEGLAVHRGSLLGGMAVPQPAQKGFETALAADVAGLDPQRPVLVEAESSKIGRINLPPALWSAMITAPRIEISAPMPARAAHLARDYEKQLNDTEGFIDKLQPLRQFRGHAAVDRWAALLRSGDRIGLVTALMEEHYDPTYAKSRAEKSPELLAEFRSETLDQAGQKALAKEIGDLVRRM
jgi:tRNA 2-selenouridine synthase